MSTKLDGGVKVQGLNTTLLLDDARDGTLPCIGMHGMRWVDAKDLNKQLTSVL